LRVEQRAESNRWRRHRADVWCAYGAFLAGFKADVSGSARAYIEVTGRVKLGMKTLENGY
jgi:hypothetical protein